MTLLGGGDRWNYCPLEKSPHAQKPNGACGLPRHKGSDCSTKGAATVHMEHHYEQKGGGGSDAVSTSPGVRGISRLHRELMEKLQSETLDSSSRSHVLKLAWSILDRNHLYSFELIRRTRPSEFSEKVSPENREPVSCALSTVGWIEYASTSHHFDRAAQMLERAIILTPHKLDRVERFAIIATEIGPTHLLNLSADPRKQLQTVIGYKHQASVCVEAALESAFGITWPILQERNGETLNHLLQNLDCDDLLYLTRSLSYLGSLHASQAEFYQNGVHAGRAVATGCSTLQCLGLSRNIVEAVNTMRNWLEGTSPEDVFELDLRQVSRALDAISRGFHVKWARFNNESAGDKAELIDRLCEVLEGAGKTQ